jgi:hypothetical protein
MVATLGGMAAGIEVRADHGMWAAGWRLALQGVVRAAGPRRRVVLFGSLGVVAAGFVAAVVVGLLHGFDRPVVTVVVLVGVFALVAYLVVAVELLLWMLGDRRRIRPVDVDLARLERVRSEIGAGRGSMVDPADRRALSRFARVQQLSLPATVLVHVLGVSVGLVLAGLEALGGSTGLIVLGLAVVIVAINGWSLVGALRSLGSTPELVALDR